MKNDLIFYVGKDIAGTCKAISVFDTSGKHLGMLLQSVNVLYEAFPFAENVFIGNPNEQMLYYKSERPGWGYGNYLKKILRIKVLVAM